MTGLVQKLGNICWPDWLVLIESATMAKSVAVEESLQGEWQRLSRLVAVAVGSRGSRLSVLEIASSSFFMAGAVGFLLSRHTVKGLKSLLNSVAKLSMIGGKVETGASKSRAQTARVAEVAMLGNMLHWDRISGANESLWSKQLRVAFRKLQMCVVAKESLNEFVSEGSWTS